MTNDIIEPLAQEETDLVLHSRLCAQRYLQITDNLDRLDKRLASIESAVQEIRNLVVTKDDANLRRYLQWAGYAITTLLGCVGYLATHYVLK